MIDNYLKELEIMKQTIIRLSMENIKNSKSLPEENIKILDRFFEKTSNGVIKDILERITRKLSYENGSDANKSFTVATLIAIFPDKFHSPLAISYLENKYLEKIIKLQLDEIGILGCHIKRDNNIKGNSFYEIPYSDCSQYNDRCNFKYRCSLEVRFCVKSQKVLRLIEDKKMI